MQSTRLRHTRNRNNTTCTRNNILTRTRRDSYLYVSNARVEAERCENASLTADPMLGSSPSLIVSELEAVSAASRSASPLQSDEYSTKRTNVGLLTCTAALASSAAALAAAVRARAASRRLSVEGVANTSGAMVPRTPSYS